MWNTIQKFQKHFRKSKVFIPSRRSKKESKNDEAFQYEWFFEVQKIEKNWRCKRRQIMLKKRQRIAPRRKDKRKQTKTCIQKKREQNENKGKEDKPEERNKKRNKGRKRKSSKKGRQNEVLKKGNENIYPQKRMQKERMKTQFFRQEERPFFQRKVFTCEMDGETHFLVFFLEGRVI